MHCDNICFNAKLAKWFPHKPILPELDNWLGGKEQYYQCVKKNIRRTIYALKLAEHNQSSYYIKHDHPTHKIDIFKSFISPKVLNEFKSLKLLRDHGVFSVEPIACGWLYGQGVLLTKALANGKTAESIWPEIRDNEMRRQRFLNGLGLLIAALIKASIFHPDLHFGNILVVEEKSFTNCYLVDVYGVRAVRSLSYKKRMSILRLLFEKVARELHIFEIKNILQSLFPNKNIDHLETLWHSARTLMARQMNHKWPDRRSKLINTNGKSNSICKIKIIDNGVWRWRNNIDLSLAQSAIKSYKDKKMMETKGDNILNIISHCEIDNQSFVVKEFKKIDNEMESSVDCKYWLNNWRLEIAGFPVPKCLAWFRNEEGIGYLVIESLRGLSFSDYLKRFAADDFNLESLLDKLFLLLNDLFIGQIFHEKIGMFNIIVCGESGRERLYLTDNEVVQFDCKIKDRHWEFNYRKISETIPSVPGLKEQFDRYFIRAKESYFRNFRSAGVV